MEPLPGAGGDRRVADDAVGAGRHVVRDARAAMHEQGAETDVHFERAGFERGRVIGGAQVVADRAGHDRDKLRPGREQACGAPTQQALEPCRHDQRQDQEPCQREHHAFQ